MKKYIMPFSGKGAREYRQVPEHLPVGTFRCVLIIIKFYLNYLCLRLSLFGIFALNASNRSSLRFFSLENKSTQK